jgi:hypothetical protein
MAQKPQVADTIPFATNVEAVASAAAVLKLPLASIVNGTAFT